MDFTIRMFWQLIEASGPNEGDTAVAGRKNEKRSLALAGL